MRERKDNPYSSMPQFVRFPVETREDFRAFARERLQPNLAARIGEDYVAQLTALRERDVPLLIVADRWGGFFGGLRNMVGVERLCTLFYDDPAFIEEMMDTLADFIIAIMGQVLDYTDVDVFGFWEDMAYKTAPLIGPEMMRIFMLPRYRRVVEYLRGRGVPFICAGQRWRCLVAYPGLAGCRHQYPLPLRSAVRHGCAAGAQNYGRDLRLWFGIDKRALAQGPAGSTPSCAACARWWKKAAMSPASITASRRMCRLPIIAIIWSNCEESCSRPAHTPAPLI